MATPALKMEAPQSTSAALFSSPDKRRVVISLLLALLSLVIYNPVTRMGFVNYDDPAYVTANRHVQGGLTWKMVRWAFLSTDAANWHPLTWLSHALDCQLFQLKAAGHHYDSLLLHALCVVILFLFLHSITGCAGRSMAVAALFAVHPINVESVAWISERKNVLCTLFFFLGLYVYQWYVRHPEFKRYLALVVTFALALMAKPMAITFPCVLLLLDYWPLRRMDMGAMPTDASDSTEHTRSLPWLVLEKLPLLLLSAASGIITVIAQKGGGALRTEYGLSLRIGNAVIAYARYVGKAFWPSKLAALYPFPRNGVPAWEVAAAALLIVAISCAAMFMTHRRYLAVGWFWFLGTLVPVIGLVQVGEQAMADRYAYIPFVGLFITLVWGFADWAANHKIASRYMAITGTTCAFALALSAHAQMKYWANTTDLWSHTLEVTEPNFVAEDNLGAELIKEGKIEAARDRFQRAIDINPKDPFSQLNIGVCEKKMGNIQSAAEHYQAALKLSVEPNLRLTAFSNLGSLYRMSHNYEASRANYQAALRINPENAMPLIGLGLLAYKTGDAAGAVNYYFHGLALEPSDVGYILLARALEAAGRKNESSAALEQAKRLAPDFGAAQNEASRLLAQ
ncbi:MAG TPA: tetratricopeptide repeat protein [Candidatus Sulfotelmatobacter sp.]